MLQETTGRPFQIAPRYRDFGQSRIDWRNSKGTSASARNRYVRNTQRLWQMLFSVSSYACGPLFVVPLYSLPTHIFERLVTRVQTLLQALQITRLDVLVFPLQHKKSCPNCVKLASLASAVKRRILINALLANPFAVMSRDLMLPAHQRSIRSRTDGR